MLGDGYWTYMRRGTLNSVAQNLTHDLTTVFDGGSITVYSEADSKNETFTATTTNTSKGSFGFGLRTFTASNYAITQIFSIKNVKVTLNDVKAPEYELMTLEVCVPKNTRTDLSEITVAFDKETYMSGEDVQWIAQRDEFGEVLNDTFTAFKTGVTTLTAVYEGKEVKVNVRVIEDTAAATLTVSEPFAESYITVTPVDTYSTLYSISVAAPDGQELKPGSLKVTENGAEYKVINPTDRTAVAYNFETASINNLSVVCEFTDATAADLAVLGATVRQELTDDAGTVTQAAGIRFGTRVNAIRYESDGAIRLQNRVLTVDGTEYTIKEVGTLLLPQALITDELTVDSKYVARKKSTSVVSSTNLYSDIAVVLKIDNLEDFADTVIASRAYMLYTDESGNEHYVYGDVIERSYNDVMAKVPAGNYNEVAQLGWEAMLSTVLSATDRKSIESEAISRLTALCDTAEGRNLVKLSVFENTDGAYELTYSGKVPGTTPTGFSVKHILYADSDYSVDFTNADAAKQAINDICFYAGSQAGVTYTSSSDGLKITSSNDSRPLSTLTFPAYQSGDEYVFEADIVMTGKTSATWATLNFAMQGPDERLNAWMQYTYTVDNTTLAIARRLPTGGTNYGASATSAKTYQKVANLIADGTLDANKFTLSGTNYTAKNTASINYRVVVTGGKAYYYLDDVLVSEGTITEGIPFNGFFGISTTTVRMTIKNIRVSSNTNPSNISINGNALDNYNIVVDTADDNAVYAAERLNTYLEENAGYTLAVVDDSTAATSYEIVLGDTTRVASTVDGTSNPEKYEGYLDGDKFCIFFGDDQSAEMAIDEFCNNIIGKGSSAYVLGNMSIDVTESTTNSFAGQWDVIQTFALFADTHIGRYENSASWYTGSSDTSATTLYRSESEIAAAYKAAVEGTDTTYYDQLKNSHHDMISAFKHISYLNENGTPIDFIEITGDVTETGYNWDSTKRYESKRCWEAYQHVLAQAFGTGESAKAYSVSMYDGGATTATGLPIYDIVGNHEEWNGSGDYSLTNWAGVTNDTQFLRHRVWYTEKNGKKIANVSFHGSYGSPTHKINDTDLAALEANLKIASKSGAEQILVYNHYGLYTTGSTSIYNSDSIAKISALCKKYGAQVYMSGHIHEEDWEVTTDGYINNVDVGWAVGGLGQTYGGTYAVVTVTDRRAIYTIYSANYDDSSLAESSDFATKKPIKTVVINLEAR